MLDLTRECSSHPILGDVDYRLGYPVVEAQFANTPYAATDLLDQPHAVEHTEKERIAGDALRAQILFTHPGRQSARRHDLQTVAEDMNLYVRGRTIVPMNYGVDKSFPQGAFGKLQTFVPTQGMRYQSRVQPGLQIRHTIFKIEKRSAVNSLRSLS